MTGLTVADLDHLRAVACTSADSDTYVVALRKAPRLVTSVHLARVALHLLVLAARHAAGRTR